MILNNVVETLMRDPENGVVKLLETAKKNTHDPNTSTLLNEAIHYYDSSITAKQQIRNLVHNTNRNVLLSFASRLYDDLNRGDFALTFLKLISIDQAAALPNIAPFFPVIELKNIDEVSQTVLARLKAKGHLFFASIALTEKNFETVTSDTLIRFQIKHGVRAILYRFPEATPDLQAKWQEKIQNIRTTRPILAFLITKKDAPNGAPLSYLITETIRGEALQVRLDLQ